MGRFLKKGKVVIVLSGRYAGKKAVIMKAFDKGTEERKFGHALVAGIAAPPRAITKSMGKKKQDRRSRIKPFIKRINYNHIMPTRYAVSDLDFKGVSQNTSDVEAKKESLKKLKQVFQARYKGQKAVAKGSKTSKAETGAAYLFAKLRF